MITIESSSQNPSCLNSFLALPALLHSTNPCWTPRPVEHYARLLDVSQNPYWKQADRELFVAWKDGQPVGRIAALDDREFADQYQHDLGFFSFFDCIDDQLVANALVAVAARWLQQRGRKQMRGPYGPSVSLPHDQGIQTSGFDYKQAIGEPFHAPYCQRLLEACGMTKFTDCLAFRLPGSPAPGMLKERFRKRLKEKKELCIRPFDVTRKEHDMNVLRTVMRDAYSSELIPIFSPEVETAAIEASITNDDWGLVFLAFINDEPAGLYITVPNTDDLYQKYPGQLRLPTTESDPGATDVVCADDQATCDIAADARIISGSVIEFAVTRAHQNSAVTLGLIYAFWDAVCARGYQYNTAFCIDEDNATMISVIQGFDGEIVKRMRLYDCDIEYAVTLSDTSPS